MGKLGLLPWPEWKMLRLKALPEVLSHWQLQPLSCNPRATHSSTIIWKTPWTKEPGGLQFTSWTGLSD